MQRLNHYAVERLEAAAAEGVTSDKPTYYVNLDPAVKTVGVSLTNSTALHLSHALVKIYIFKMLYFVDDE